MLPYNIPSELRWRGDNNSLEVLYNIFYITLNFHDGKHENSWETTFRVKYYANLFVYYY
jgi:hypothetical protein